MPTRGSPARLVSFAALAILAAPAVAEPALDLTGVYELDDARLSLSQREGGYHASYVQGDVVLRGTATATALSDGQWAVLATYPTHAGARGRLEEALAGRPRSKAPAQTGTYVIDGKQGTIQGTTHLSREGALQPQDRRGRLRRPPELGRVAFPQGLPDLKGKVVLIDYWGTFCAPCLRAMPHLGELQRKHADDGLQVLGLSCELDAQGRPDRSDAAHARSRAVAEKAFAGPAPYPLGLLDAFPQVPLPTVVLLDRSGRVRHVFEGASAATGIDAAVAALLAEDLATGPRVGQGPQTPETSPRPAGAAPPPAVGDAAPRWEVAITYCFP